MDISRGDKIDALIWDELVQAKTWEQYISEYTGHKIDRQRYFSIITIVLAILGSTSWAAWKAFGVDWMEYLTPISLLLAGISQLLSAIQSKIIIDNDALKSLSRLRSLYIGYYNKMEKLYLNVIDDIITKEEKENIFFDLREMVYPIEELKDSLNIKELKKINKTVYKRMEMYLKDRWNVTFSY